MDWTIPVSVAVFFLGVLSVLALYLLVGHPRFKVADRLQQANIELKERVHNLAVDLATFKGREFQKLRQDADDHTKQISSLQNVLVAKQLGR